MHVLCVLLIEIKNHKFLSNNNEMIFTVDFLMYNMLLIVNAAH